MRGIDRKDEGKGDWLKHSCNSLQLRGSALNPQRKTQIFPAFDS
jgi:hypothetical protein